MPSKLTRRNFLTLTAGATLFDLASRGEAAVGDAPTSGEAAATSLPRPAEAPFDTVVVLMMENRSFDHVLGWLPGANGRQQGLSYADAHGTVHETWPLAPEWQGCKFEDPDHTRQGSATQYVNGHCSGFLRTAP